MSNTENPSPHISFEKNGSIAWIKFCNQDRLNALTAHMWSELPEIISEAYNDPDTRILIFRGEGEKAFSAGADISEFAEVRAGENAQKYDKLNHEAFKAILSCPKPTLAMIHGFCLGGGFQLAACCDLRFASEKAKFALPPAKLGIGYDPRWIRTLLRLTTPANIKEMLFTAERYSAEQALHMGLINRMIGFEKLEDEIRSFAEITAQNAPLSIMAGKAAIDELSARGEHADLNILDQKVSQCYSSADYAEGFQAFLEKRRPVFRGA